MLQAEPFVTPYDFRFQLFGIPIRVQALFWLVAVLFGAQWRDGATVLLVVCAMFASILVHELGHSLVMAKYGIRSHIVLYWLGGLAIQGQPQSSPWASFSTSWEPPRKRDPWQQIVISLAGPAAGFAFAAVIAAALLASGGQFEFLTHPTDLQRYFPVFWSFSLPAPWQQNNPHLVTLVGVLLQFNILWGLLNLLPVFPLDGGQIAREVLQMRDPWQGTAQSLLLSTIVAGAAAVMGLVVTRDNVTFILFLSLAASSYFAWQQISRQGRW